MTEGAGSAPWRRGPRGPGARPSLLLVALVFGGSLLLSACAPTEEGWRRVDLWDAPPAGAVATERLLGTGLPDPNRPEAVHRRMGAKVRALELEPGRAASWNLDLGRGPFLRFVPFPTGVAHCRARYRVEVAADGDSDPGTTVYDEIAVRREAPSIFGPAAEEIDLGPRAQGAARLTVTGTLEGPGCGPHIKGRKGLLALGSPAVYSLGEFEVPRRPNRPPGPNVILIGADTLRADHLGAWGHTPSVTPALDRLAAESDVFTQAFSTFNVTNPSFASLLTGLYGKNHGVYDLRTPLPESFDTLAELFSRAGYRTQAVTAATHLSREQSGLSQGFDGYHVPWGQATADMAVGQAIDWIQRVDGPFFLWLHLFDAHTPYTPPSPYALGRRPAGAPGLGPIRQWQEFRLPGPLDFDDPVLGGHGELYRGEVAYLDRQVGRLLGFLESRGLLEDTVIAFTADHGENLGEQGVRYRHAGLWDATVHVPLMVRWPAPPGEARGRRVEGLVQTLDLFPTLLRGAGLDVPDSDGEDLLELTGDGRRGRRVVFAEATDGRAHMVRTPDHLYMRREGDHFLFDAPAFLFDLTADPEQEHNLAGQRPELEAELGGLLERWLADRSASRAAPVDLAPEEIERLRALGYIDP
ncbi:MAG: sulfatase [Acidobacteriota bacterium]